MDAVESIGRVLISLALVLGVMWLLGRWARSRTGGKAKSRETLTVLARQQLSRNASVAVVKVADRALVIGITEGQVNLLGDADLAALEAELDAKRGPEQRGPAQRGPAQRRPAQRSSLPAKHEIQTENPELAAAFQTLAPSALGSSGAPSAPRRHRSRPATRGLEGSALSAATWMQAVDALRERTVRR